jgi:pyruvate/2-oxoglutarate/acetoin dehydrogenase E1 component
MKYFDELSRSMKWLGEQPDTYFIGQSVEVEGTGIFGTLKDVQMTKRLELPVFENTQLGMSLGMALNGTRVISIFPRFNFLICATDQLVNHLDKLKTYSHGQYQPSVIIRTSVGSERPLHPQSQHVGNFSEAYRKMLTNIEIIELNEPEDIFPAYEKAYTRSDGKSTILVEYGDYYNER